MFGCDIRHTIELPPQGVIIQRRKLWHSSGMRRMQNLWQRGQPKLTTDSYEGTNQSIPQDQTFPPVLSVLQTVRFP